MLSTLILLNKINRNLEQRQWQYASENALENRRACHLNCTGLISPRSTEILVISHFFCRECQRTLPKGIRQGESNNYIIFEFSRPIIL